MAHEKLLRNQMGQAKAGTSQNRLITDVETYNLNYTKLGSTPRACYGPDADARLLVQKGHKYLLQKKWAVCGFVKSTATGSLSKTVEAK